MQPCTSRRCPLPSLLVCSSHPTQVPAVDCSLWSACCSLPVPTGRLKKHRGTSAVTKSSSDVANSSPSAVSADARPLPCALQAPGHAAHRSSHLRIICSPQQDLDCHKLLAPRALPDLQAQHRSCLYRHHQWGWNVLRSAMAEAFWTAAAPLSCPVADSGPCCSLPGRRKQPADEYAGGAAK